MGLEPPASDVPTEPVTTPGADKAQESTANPNTLQDLDFDDGKLHIVLSFDDENSATSEDETNLHSHARRNAQEAVLAARRQAQLFDAQTALDRKTNEALALAKGQAHVHEDDNTKTSTRPLVDREFEFTVYAHIILH